MTARSEPVAGAPWGPACGVRPAGGWLTAGGLLLVVVCPGHLVM